MRDNDAHQKALASAIQWLQRAQDEDGSWKSQTYGGMKQGAALTSLVLYAMSHLPDAWRDKSMPAIDRTMEFLGAGIEKRQQVANTDGSLDNPVYATAMYLAATKKLGRAVPAGTRSKLVDFLVASQVSKPRGFDDENPQSGGWDVLGPDVKPGKTSGPNISVTRYVVEAMASFYRLDRRQATAQGFDGPSQDRIVGSERLVKKWLTFLFQQSGELGSTFSTQPKTALNKARDIENKAIPYGSANCDYLIACNAIFEDQSGYFAAAADWIKGNPAVDSVPGFEAMPNKPGWSQGLYFYYCQALGASLSILKDRDWAPQRLSDLKDAICKRQQSDGRFQNPVALMREDDPIIATSFAVIALAASTR